MVCYEMGAVEMAKDHLIPPMHGRMSFWETSTPDFSVALGL